MSLLRQFPRFSKQIAFATNKLEHLRSRIRLPEKYKGGRLEKIGIYWKSLCEDYGAAVRDIISDSRSRPRKAAVVVSGLGFLGCLMTTNPDEVSYRDAVAECSNAVLQLSDAIRNPESDAHLRHVEQCLNEGTIRTLNLLALTVVWEDDFGRDSDVFAAHCSYLRPQWLRFHQRVLDVGLLGNWVVLALKMRDFDVNSAEWGDTARS